MSSHTTTNLLSQLQQTPQQQPQQFQTPIQQLLPPPRQPQQSQLQPPAHLSAVPVPPRISSTPYGAVLSIAPAGTDTPSHNTSSHHHTLS